CQLDRYLSSAPMEFQVGFVREVARMAPHGSSIHAPRRVVSRELR
ncbi:MAG: hypothetical protein ACI8WY_003485, partial [Planctomycetota bacterium]